MAIFARLIAVIAFTLAPAVPASADPEPVNVTIQRQVTLQNVAEVTVVLQVVCPAGMGNAFAGLSQENNGLSNIAFGTGNQAFFASGGRQQVAVTVTGGPFNVGDGLAFASVSCPGFSANDSRPVVVSP